MSTSAGMNAAGYNLLLTVSHIIFIFAYYARSNFVMNFASINFLVLIFWIKLIVKLANLPTQKSSAFSSSSTSLCTSTRVVDSRDNGIERAVEKEVGKKERVPSPQVNVSRCRQNL
jgi:hypothetical protein